MKFVAGETEGWDKATVRDRETGEKLHGWTWFDEAEGKCERIDVLENGALKADNDGNPKLKVFTRPIRVDWDGFYPPDAPQP